MNKTFHIYLFLTISLSLCHDNLTKGYDPEMSNLHIILSCILVKVANIMNLRFGGDVVSIRGSCDCRDGFYFNGNDCLPNVSMSFTLQKVPKKSNNNFFPTLVPFCNTTGGGVLLS